MLIRRLTVLLALIALTLAGCGKGDQSNQTNQNGQGTQESQSNQPTRTTTGNVSTPSGQESKETKMAGEPTNTTLTVPENTPLEVKLSETVQTNTNQSGDRFTGTVARAVEANGAVLIPEGSKVNLVITDLVKGGTLKTPPEIAFTVKSVTLPDGSTYDVQASSFSSKGRSHTKREVGMIGGGAAAGAIIGALAGKGKGAVIGAAAGAAAGTGAAAATGRQNLVYEAGQTITFSLKKPLYVNALQR
jgi:outer membrane lipoprotein SlyB